MRDESGTRRGIWAPVESIEFLSRNRIQEYVSVSRLITAGHRNVEDARMSVFCLQPENA